MDSKVRELLNRVKEGAVTYGKAAGKFASDAAEKARMNLQIFDLNTEIDIAFKEIGKLVYAMHAGEEVSGEAVQAQIDSIDSKKTQLCELRARLASYKAAQAGDAEEAEASAQAEDEPCCCDACAPSEECCCECTEKAAPSEECCCCTEKAAPEATEGACCCAEADCCCNEKKDESIG